MRRGYLAVHIALFLYAFIVISIHSTARRLIPAPPPSHTSNAPTALAIKIPMVIPSDSGDDAFSHLGTRPLFATLIPRPRTPPPTPPPSPPPPPIKKLTATWRLVAILPGGVAQFEDKITRDGWTIRRGETRTVKYGRETAHIHLAEVDEDQFTVRLTTDFPGDDQERTMSLFGNSGQ